MYRKPAAGRLWLWNRATHNPLKEALLRERIPVTGVELLEVWGVAAVLPPVVTARSCRR
ncbi:hypothetical protein ABZ621_21005 [Streptomyces sp. NPDC007863]|uniref:hypothetical protein n=1 Tax=Streptomyces sp. NPDC007863 TaxID=3154894 RepID=UPI003410FC15